MIKVKQKKGTKKLTIGPMNNTLQQTGGFQPQGITPTAGWQQGPTATPRNPNAPGYVAPPPAITPQARPFDAQYENDKAYADKNYDQTMAENTYQLGQIEQRYGFVDPSNPFNEASMLQRAYQQGQTGTTNSMAARGQLYAGSTSNALDEGTFKYNRSYDDLSRAYNDAKHGITASNTAAGLTRDQAKDQANYDSIARIPPAEESTGGPGPQPQAPSKTNNTAVASLGPRGAIRAEGKGGGVWAVRWKDGTLKTMKLVAGKWQILVNGKWKPF